MSNKRMAMLAPAVLLGLGAFLFLRSGLDSRGTRGVEPSSSGSQSAEEGAVLLELPDAGSRVPGPVAPTHSGTDVQEEEAGLDGVPRVAGAVNGLTLRIEDAGGLPVVGAEVALYWRAGWGDYQDVRSVTNSRGEVTSALQSAFQVEDMTVTLADSEVTFTISNNTCLPDLRRTGLIRYALPGQADVLVRLTDSEGRAVPSAEIEVERRRTLPLSSGLNVLRREGEIPETVTDAMGEVGLLLDEGAYLFSAEAVQDGRTAATVAGVAPSAAPVIVELQLGVTDVPEKRSRSFRGAAPLEPSQTSRAADRSATLEGQVVEASTRKPIAGASLAIVNRLPRRSSSGDSQSDAFGRFKVSGWLRGGESFLFASAKGYAWAASSVGPSSEGGRVTVEMEPAQRIEGRAVDADGAPVAGTAFLFTPRARVGLPSGGSGLEDPASYYGQPVESLGTGAPGTFHFSGATAALHRIWFRPEDPALPPAVSIAQGGDLNVLLRVGDAPEGYGSAHGLVRDRITGKGVPGLKVHYWGEHTPLSSDGVTGSDGKYVIHGLKPGEFHVSLAHASESAGLKHYAFERTLVVVKDGDQEIPFSVSPARTLQLLLVTGGQGHPVRGAQVAAYRSNGVVVELQDDAGYREGDFMTTDWNGRVDLIGLPAGPLELRIWEADSAPGEPTFRRALDVSQPKPQIVTLRL